MSFVSNKRTRRTKRACTHHTSFKSVLSSTGAPSMDDPRFNRGLQGAVRIQTAETTTIGSHNSRGLTIQGGSVADSYMYPTNPDNHDPAMLISTDSAEGLPENRLKAPPFPITYNGPGHLAWQSGFSVPYIIGSTEIKGDLIVQGSLTVKESFGAQPGAFAPVIQDALGNTLTVSVVQSTYKVIDFADYFECCISWTAKSLADASEVRLYGFPLSTYSNLSFGTCHVDYGIIPNGIGAQIESRAVAGQDYLEFFQADMSTNLPNVKVVGENFLPAGSICIRGLLTKT